MTGIYYVRNLCRCGHPVLNSTIPIGAKYELDHSSTSDGTLVCGGCGAHIPVMLIWAVAETTGNDGWLPMGIFKMPAEKLT